jgi:hypothetical protein
LNLRLPTPDGGHGGRGVPVDHWGQGTQQGTERRF